MSMMAIRLEGSHCFLMAVLASALSTSCAAKNPNIATECWLIERAAAIFPFTISENAADSPLLGGIIPVFSVSSAGMGWVFGEYRAE